MEIIAASAGSYPRIGNGADQQRHRQAFARLELGEITEDEFEVVQDEVTRDVIDEQNRAGLDLVTDGQVRWYDPVSHIARGLEGCEIDGLLRFFDSNFYFRQPVVTSRLSRPVSILKREFVFAQGVSRRPVKPVLTGPYTMAKLSKNRRRVGLRRLVNEFADIIAQEVRDLAEAGAVLIQVDEPAILRCPREIGILDTAIETVHAERGHSELAVYTYFGDAARLYGKLIKLPVEAIGLDFIYGPRLMGAVERLGCEVDLGLGLIDGRNTRLENHKNILDKIERISSAVEAERLYLNPSCGLGDYLPREIAFEKVKNMALIAKKARRLTL